MDSALGSDALGVSVGTTLHEGAFGTTLWTIERFDEYKTAGLTRYLNRQPTADDFAEYGYEPYSVTQVKGNLITNAGWTRLMSLLTATGTTQALAGATSTRIGVGNSTTAQAYTDVDLAAVAGAANRWFQPVTGAATLGTRQLSFSASFGTADGNFAWNEFGIDVSAPTVAASAVVGTLLFNRVAGIAQGTKASGQTWSATATITFT
jgi:hypothetical protein